MVRTWHILLLFVLLSPAVAAVGVNAAGPWDGEYRGEGKFDGDRKCIPSKFEAIGIIESNSLTMTIIKEGKTVKTKKFKISNNGRIPSSYFCSTTRVSAVAHGYVKNNIIQIEVEAYLINRPRSGLQGSGTITLSRAPSQ